MNFAVIMFLVFGGLALVGAVLLFDGAKSGLHGIEALLLLIAIFMLLLIAVVFLVGAAVVEAIFRAVARLERRN